MVERDVLSAEQGVGPPPRRRRAGSCRWRELTEKAPALRLVPHNVRKEEADHVQGAIGPEGDALRAIHLLVVPEFAEQLATLGVDPQDVVVGERRHVQQPGALALVERHAHRAVKLGTLDEDLVLRNRLCRHAEPHDVIESEGRHEDRAIRWVLEDSVRVLEHR